MIRIFFDTNIWIGFIAQGLPNGILDEIEDKIGSSEIEVFTNEIIVDEWNRNKEKTLSRAKNSVAGPFNNTKKAFELFQDIGEGEKFGTLIKEFLSSKEELIEAAEKQVKDTERLLLNCEKKPITDEMSLQASNWALDNHSPFDKNKNSMADALILLSSLNCSKEKSIGVTDSIFVSNNHKDFSK